MRIILHERFPPDLMTSCESLLTATVAGSAAHGCVVSMSSHRTSSENRPRPDETRPICGHFCSSRRRSSSSRLSRLSFHSGRFSDLSRRSSRLVNSRRPVAACALSSRQRILRRHAANQILAVDHDALVGGVVHDFAPVLSHARVWNSGRGAAGAGARGGGVGRTLGARLLQLHVLDRRSRGSCRAARSSAVLLVKAVRLFALDTEDADELAAHEQRHAQLAFGIRQPRQRNARARTLGFAAPRVASPARTASRASGRKYESACAPRPPCRRCLRRTAPRRPRRSRSSRGWQS